MSKKNKIYWFEGVTEKGVKALLNDENSKFRWLRPQKNRRVLVVLMAIGLVLTSMGSYWPTIKTNLNLSPEVGVIVYSVTVIFVILVLVGGYSLLRIAVRSIADAPDELLDERQIAVRNTSFRYAYFILGYILLALMVMVIFGLNFKCSRLREMMEVTSLSLSFLHVLHCLSMVMAWRERDI